SPFGSWESPMSTSTHLIGARDAHERLSEFVPFEQFAALGGSSPVSAVLFLLVRNSVGALRLAPAKGEILAGSLVERDHQVVRRHAGRRSDQGVDVFQEGQPRLLRPPFDESEIEDN